jgi:hypothetical protein
MIKQFVNKLTVRSITRQVRANSPNVQVYNSLFDCHLKPKIDPVTGKLTTVFSLANTIIFNDCEKNAVFYNLDKFRFPNARNVVLFNSHPCDYNVPHRFPEALWIVSSGYGRYFRDIENYHELSYLEYSKLKRAFKSCDYFSSASHIANKKN